MSSPTPRLPIKLLPIHAFFIEHIFHTQPVAHSWAQTHTVSTYLARSHCLHARMQLCKKEKRKASWLSKSINSNLQVNGVSLCGQDDLVRACTAGPAAKKQNRKGDLKWKPIWTFGHPGGVLQKEWSNKKSEVTKRVKYADWVTGNWRLPIHGLLASGYFVCVAALSWADCGRFGHLSTRITNISKQNMVTHYSLNLRTESYRTRQSPTFDKTEL